MIAKDDIFDICIADSEYGSVRHVLHAKYGNNQIWTRPSDRNFYFVTNNGVSISDTFGSNAFYNNTLKTTSTTNNPGLAVGTVYNSNASVCLAAFGNNLYRSLNGKKFSLLKAGTAATRFRYIVWWESPVSTMSHFVAVYGYGMNRIVRSFDYGETWETVFTNTTNDCGFTCLKIIDGTLYAVGAVQSESNVCYHIVCKNETGNEDDWSVVKSGSGYCLSSFDKLSNGRFIVGGYDAAYARWGYSTNEMSTITTGQISTLGTEGWYNNVIATGNTAVLFSGSSNHISRYTGTATSLAATYTESSHAYGIYTTQFAYNGKFYVPTSNGTLLESTTGANGSWSEISVLPSGLTGRINVFAKKG